MPMDLAMTTPDGAEYSIRYAEIRHIRALKAVELAAATIFPPGSLPEHVLAEYLPPDVLSAAQQENMLLVALDGGGIAVGYLLLQEVAGLALLAQVDVHPGHGRKGLGTALVRCGIERMRELGFAELYLTTFAHVPWNAPWYAKLGFTVLPEQDIPQPIGEILREERARGLTDRVAMRLSLHHGA